MTDPGKFVCELICAESAPDAAGMYDLQNHAVSPIDTMRLSDHRHFTPPGQQSAKVEDSLLSNALAQCSQALHLQRCTLLVVGCKAEQNFCKEVPCRFPDLPGVFGLVV